jgi:transposase
MKITRVGVDLAKKVFQVHGVDAAGHQVWKRQLKRSSWLSVLTETVEPGCKIGMEACGGAHHWARELKSRGFKVKLISPQFVKPYLKSLKNDVNDAEAICEAMTRHHMRFVAVKTVAQQDIQAIHRVREGLMNHRKAKANQIRGLVAEYGLVAPRQMAPLRRAIPCWLEDAENGLRQPFRVLLHGLWEDLQRMDERLKVLDKEILMLSESHPDAKRLKQLRGTATRHRAIDGHRDGGPVRRWPTLQAWPPGVCLSWHHSAGTGGKNWLFGITKKGNPYLRSILIHGARSVVSKAKHKDDRLSRWVTELAKRKHPNVAAVALANKTVRIAWAMLRNGTDYDPELAMA